MFRMRVHCFSGFGEVSQSSCRKCHVPRYPSSSEQWRLKGTKQIFRLRGKCPNPKGEVFGCFFQPTTTSDGDNRSYEQQIPSSLTKGIEVTKIQPRVCLPFRHFLIGQPLLNITASHLRFSFLSFLEFLLLEQPSRAFLGENVKI
jgi:hypothetical protein